MFPIKEKNKKQKGVNYKGQKMQQGDEGSCSVKLAPNDLSAQPFSFIFFLFFSDLKMACRPAQAQKKKKLCTLAAFSRLQPAVCGEGRRPPTHPHTLLPPKPRRQLLPVRSITHQPPLPAPSEMSVLGFRPSPRSRESLAGFSVTSY